MLEGKHVDCDMCVCAMQAEFLKPVVTYNRQYVGAIGMLNYCCKRNPQVYKFIHVRALPTSQWPTLTLSRTSLSAVIATMRMATSVLMSVRC